MGKYLSVAEKWDIDSEAPMGGMVFEGTADWSASQRENRRINKMLKTQNEEEEREMETRDNEESV